MHRTLTPQFNFFFIAFCLAVLLAAFIFTPWQQFISVIGITLPIGIVAGLLQARALDSRQAEFQGSRTAMDVRRALVASFSGTISIVLLRVTAIAALVWAISSNSHSKVFIWLAGCMSFLISRNLFALPAVLRLSRSR